MKGELVKFEQKIRECHTPEEEESRSSGGGASKRSKAIEASGTEGASIEVVRRPRGRPPGSKNKPKPPVVITRDPSEAPMQPHILELPAGVDVVDAVSRFARRRNVGLCILSGSGNVSNVTLRQPPGCAALTLNGRFDIVSISATFLPPRPPPSPASPPPPSGFDFHGLSISIAGPQGQIVGGFVAGPLIAAGTVVVLAAAFTSPSYHRLPLDDDASAAIASSSGADATTIVAPDSGGSHQHGPAHGHHGVVESMYSPHVVPSHHHIIWAPAAARQALPPPPPPHPYS